MTVNAGKTGLNGRMIIGNRSLGINTLGSALFFGSLGLSAAYERPLRKALHIIANAKTFSC
jgi:hypothetical protein